MEIRDGVLQRSLIASEYRHAVAECGQALGRSPADSRRSAANHSDGRLVPPIGLRAPTTAHDRSRPNLNRVLHREVRPFPLAVPEAKTWPNREDRDRMAKSAARPVDDNGPESIPTWKRQSVERSLKSARAKAQDRSDRFVKAGLDLIKSTGDTGFTVQEVVDRSGMSIRTFYMFFASKDDLLLAIHETILSSEVTPRLRRRIESVDDPVAKIKTFIEALFAISSGDEPARRGLVLQQHRLAEARPDDLDHAMEPQVQLFIELLEKAAKSGRLRADLDIGTTARILHQMILSVTHSRVLGSKQFGELTPDDLWDICSHAIGAASPSSSRRRRS